MAKVDPRLGAAFTLGGAGLFLFGVVILTSLLGDNPADRTMATLMAANAGVGILVAAVGRLRPGAVALALGLITVGQVLVAATMITQGIGNAAVVGAVSAVLAVPIFAGAVLALAVVVSDRRAGSE